MPEPLACVMCEASAADYEEIAECDGKGCGLVLCMHCYLYHECGAHPPCYMRDEYRANEV